MPKAKKVKNKKAEVNIGLVGHVDHGKTTLVQSLSGQWTDRHSEEIKRGISIKLGYADIDVLKCPSCDPPECYSTPALSPKNKCNKCKSPLEFVRRISFVDAPGHEILMATMISGAFLMDGACLVIAANEDCPQPQTREHYEALKICNVKNMVIAQNKIELVSYEQNMDNRLQILNFIGPELKNTIPIVPISAIHKANLDLLLHVFEEKIPTPTRDLNKPPLMNIVRSFDVNKPGTRPNGLVGGVLGCTISRGLIKVGDEIELRPGISRKTGAESKYEPVITEITTLHSGDVGDLSEADAGGLIGAGTTLDPSLTKADSLIGNIGGKPGTLPPIWDTLSLNIQLLDRVVGAKELIKVKNITPKETLMMNVGVEMTLGVVAQIKKKLIQVNLKRPVCAEHDQHVAISRRIGGRWRLIGVGTITD